MSSECVQFAPTIVVAELLPSVCAAVHAHKITNSVFNVNTAQVMLVGFMPLQEMVHALQQQRFSVSEKKVIFLNTEQLSRSAKLEELADMLIKYFEVSQQFLDVWDYSKANIALLLEHATIKQNRWLCWMFFYMPFRPVDEDVASLKHLLQVTPKVFDFAILGSLSERRLNVANKFKNMGFSVNVVAGVFGRERDVAIASCKILLNIHYADDYLIFEQARCNRWIAAGMPVMSEPSKDSGEEHLLLLKL